MNKSTTDNTPVELSFSALNKHETAQLEAAFSLKGEPYRVMRRKTKFIAKALGVDEPTAEAILLKRIDAWIAEG